MRWLARLFAEAQIPAEVTQDLRALGQRGRIVFVMRSAGWLNLSFIRWLLRRIGLPALGAAIGMSWRVRRFLLRRRGTTRGLAEAVAAGAPALVFLRRPSVVRAKGVGTPTAGKD